MSRLPTGLLFTLCCFSYNTGDCILVSYNALLVLKYDTVCYAIYASY
jgi:hypothetical protein